VLPLLSSWKCWPGGQLHFLCCFLQDPSGAAEAGHHQRGHSWRIFMPKSTSAYLGLFQIILFYNMGDVVKSPGDRKGYRYFSLENGLSVLLISDPDIYNPATQEASTQGKKVEAVVQRCTHGHAHSMNNYTSSPCWHVCAIVHFMIQYSDALLTMAMQQHSQNMPLMPIYNNALSLPGRRGIRWQ